MGYDSSKAMPSLNSMLLQVIAFLVLLGLMFLTNLFKRNNIIYRFLKRTLIYSMLIRMILESYLKMCICSLISMQSLDWNKPIEFANSIITLLLLLLYIMPVALFLFLFKNRRRLFDEEFYAKYGSFYSDINTQKSVAVYYHVIFLFRRLMVASSIIFLSNQPIL